MSEVVAPEESITVAVIECVPRLKFEIEIDSPVPRSPSMLDRQTIDWLNGPSSESLPVPRNTTESLNVICEPDAGSVIETVGCTFVLGGGAVLALARAALKSARIAAMRFC